MRAETSRELESRVETGFSFQESGLNWGRALGKSLNHFMLRGRACRAQSGLLCRPLSISLGGHDPPDPPGYGPVAMKTSIGSVGAEEGFDVLKGLDEDLLRKVLCLVADTTALNTGCKTGVFRWLEISTLSRFTRFTRSESFST